MKKKLFGQYITPDCTYCEHGANGEAFSYCKKGKRIINAKCRKFKYNPIMRVPSNSADRGIFTADDFRL